jgi:DNA-3-methyladenine glycosylase II
MRESDARAELVPRGRFSLRAAAEFGFGPTSGRSLEFDGTMRLAFAVDGGRGYAGVVLRQPAPDGPVGVELHLREGAEAERAVRQTARIVSLDHDGEAFAEVGARDHVLGGLQEAHPGQRPVLFHSPYEAAAWSIVSARRPASQAAGVRSELSRALGETFELAGRTLHAFPQPDRLVELAEDCEGLNPEKVTRLHGVARAALAGELDPEHLHALGPERAYEEVQRLKGIGPFYAGLVVLRATGFADAALMSPEPRVMTRVAQLYGLPEPPTLVRFNELAENWRPFRTWAAVLIRLAGDRRTTGPSSG